MKKFEELSFEVQEEVKKVLGSYDETHVFYENGCFTVSPHLIMKQKYHNDFLFIGTYEARKVFTREEHIKAQIMAFGYSPEYNIVFYPNKDAWSQETKKYIEVYYEYLKLMNQVK